MSVFLLHTNTLGVRGDRTNLLDLLTMLRAHRHEVIVAIPKWGVQEPSILKTLARLEVPISTYANRSSLERFARSHGADYTIAFSAGGTGDLAYSERKGDWRIADTVHITQAVFRNRRFHGDLFLFVSDWLFDVCAPIGFRDRSHFLTRSGTLVSWLPHIVEPASLSPDLESPPHWLMEINSHKGLKIGRIGGFDQFDDRAAQQGVFDFLGSNNSARFYGANTKDFGYHERISLLPPLSRDHARMFISSMDVILNGRRMGESFGLANAEALALGVPVVAPSWVRNPLMDKNHLRMLEPSFHYKSSRDLGRILRRINDSAPDPTALKRRVENYSSENIYQRLIFLIDQVAGKKLRG